MGLPYLPTLTPLAPPLAVSQQSVLAVPDRSRLGFAYPKVYDGAKLGPMSVSDPLPGPRPAALGWLAVLTGGLLAGRWWSPRQMHSTKGCFVRGIECLPSKALGQGNLNRTRRICMHV